jgi:uncharacterized protein (TIGR03000 family)
MSRQMFLFAKRTFLLTAVFLLLVPTVLAQGDGRGARSSQYPWNAPGYRGYQEPSVPWYAKPFAEREAILKKYQLRMTTLPVKNTQEDPNTALLVAHLPENARIWFDDAPTQQQGTVRQFTSPPLTPGKTYTYTVRVQWNEDGQWVSQDHSFPVHAGDAHCIDIIPTESEAAQKEVATNLAKLQSEDRKSAESQRFCAVQEGVRLGSMGVPVKVALNGQTAFLCCEACVKKAKSQPARTLEQVKKIRARNVASPWHVSGNGNMRVRAALHHHRHGNERRAARYDANDGSDEENKGQEDQDQLRHTSTLRWRAEVFAHSLKSGMGGFQRDDRSDEAEVNPAAPPRYTRWPPKAAPAARSTAATRPVTRVTTVGDEAQSSQRTNATQANSVSDDMDTPRCQRISVSATYSGAVT